MSLHYVAPTWRDNYRGVYDDGHCGIQMEAYYAETGGGTGYGFERGQGFWFYDMDSVGTMLNCCRNRGYLTDNYGDGCSPRQ